MPTVTVIHFTLLLVSEYLPIMTINKNNNYYKPYCQYFECINGDYSHWQYQCKKSVVMYTIAVEDLGGRGLGQNFYC